MRRFLRTLGDLLMTCGERCYELADHDLDVVTRAKYLEQRHTPMVIEQRGDVIEVVGCGRVVRFQVGGGR